MLRPSLFQVLRPVTSHCRSRTRIAQNCARNVRTFSRTVPKSFINHQVPTSTSIPRRNAVTEAEKSALRNLVKALAAAETFYCRGTASYNDVQQPTLMYTSDGSAKYVERISSFRTQFSLMHRLSGRYPYPMPMMRSSMHSTVTATSLTSDKGRISSWTSRTDWLESSVRNVSASTSTPSTRRAAF